MKRKSDDQTNGFVLNVRGLIILSAQILVSTVVAAAQEPTTRAGVIAAQQAAKQVTPYEPSPAEAIIRKVRTILIGQPGGFYPSVGSVYPGGGLSLGGGYRSYYRGNTFWDLHGLYSISGYKSVELSTGSVAHTPTARRRNFSLRTGWRDATQLAYYGSGMETAVGDRTNARLQQAYAGGFLEGRPHRWIALRAEADVEHYTIKEGQGVHPSIETVHTPATAPGVGADISFLRVGGTAGFDWRRSPGYTRTGGYYGATLQSWIDPDSAFSFQRLDLNVIQHVPFLRETWVLAFRGRAQTVLNDNDVVPFYLLPSLGSGGTLRAYATDRFRDRHSLLASAEWRWIPNRNFFDMSVFVDAGKVTRDRADLDFRGLRTNWGIGARFHGLDLTALRVELAKGQEGWAFIFAASPPF